MFRATHDDMSALHIHSKSFIFRYRNEYGVKRRLDLEDLPGKTPVDQILLLYAPDAPSNTVEPSCIGSRLSNAVYRCIGYIRFRNSFPDARNVNPKAGIARLQIIRI